MIGSGRIADGGTACPHAASTADRPFAHQFEGRYAVITADIQSR